MDLYIGYTKPTRQFNMLASVYHDLYTVDTVKGFHNNVTPTTESVDYVATGNFMWVELYLIVIRLCSTNSLLLLFL